MKNSNIKNGEQVSKELYELHQELEKILQDSNTEKQRDFENLSGENQELLVEFNKLTSYSEKLLFWEKHFWTMGPYGIDTYTALNKLINIMPENEKERILLNKERMALITQDFKKSYLPKTVINKNITFKELKDDYLENLKHTDDKQKLIEDEISRIIKESWEIENRRILNISRYPDQVIQGNLFLQVFQFISNNDIELDLGDKVYAKSELIEIIIGISAGKYLKFLKGELVKFKTELKAQIPDELWNGDINSLKLLWELLLDYEWIEEIEEDEFINHFTNKSYGKLINWKKEQNTFIRLFDGLSFALNPTYLFGEVNKYPSPYELSKHFKIKGIEKSSKQLTQSRSTIKGIKIKREADIKAIIDKTRQKYKN